MSRTVPPNVSVQRARPGVYDVRARAFLGGVIGALMGGDLDAYVGQVRRDRASGLWAAGDAAPAHRHRTDAVLALLDDKGVTP